MHQMRRHVIIIVDIFHMLMLKVCLMYLSLAVHHGRHVRYLNQQLRVTQLRKLVNKSDIKLRQDFTTQGEFLDYLEGVNEASVSRVMMINRLARGWHPYTVVTTKKQLKPNRSHPFKKTYGQKL